MLEFLQSKKVKIVIISIGTFIIALVIFALGISAGLHKANFSCRFGENYERNFMGMRSSDFGNQRMPLRQDGPMGMMREKINDLEGRGFRNAHGLAGTIISIAENNLVIKDQNNNENTIAISEKTLIKSGRSDLQLSDLQNEQRVIVMGRPGDNGIINADLIRVFNDNNTN